MKSIHTILTIFSILFIFSSCKKEHTPIQKAATVAGGKGGEYNIAIFPKSNKKAKSGMIYIQYGSKDFIQDEKNCSDSFATMVEPGFGPHSHFFGLKVGFYALKAICSDSQDKYTGDTIIEVVSGQAKSVDLDMELKLDQ